MSKFVFIGAALLASTPATAQLAPASIAPTARAPDATKYCAENMSDGTPYPRKICKTRAQWIRDYGVDPVQVQATVKQRGRR